MSTAECSQVFEVDVSAFEYPNDIKDYPAWENALKLAFGISLEIVALLGNTLVLLIVLRSKKMRTVTNYYIANLALADLVVACFPIWIHLVDDLSEGWVLGSVLCKFNPFMQITAMLASTFTLIVIAADRFFAVMFPLKSRVTQRKVSIVVIIVWACSIAIAMPLIFVYVYEERQWKDHLEKFCSDVWPEKNTDEGCDYGLTSKKAFWTFVCVVLNWIPMTVMAVAYTVILIKLRYNRIVPSIGPLSTSAIQNRSMRKVVRMLFSVLVGFMICAIPFQITKLYELYRVTEKESTRLPEWYSSLYFSAILLMYANSAVNPIIYGGLNDNFRQGFWDLINSLFHRNDPLGSRKDTRTRGSRLERLTNGNIRQSSQMKSVSSPANIEAKRAASDDSKVREPDIY